MFRKRIGVFVCHCGSNIAGVVRIPEVIEYVKLLPNVVHSESLLYTCSEDGLTTIKKRIKELELNRVVVASCTPRTHEWLFRNTCEQAGLNRYLFEFVNIREHCSWIHRSMPDEVTEKAKELIKMGVAKAYFLEPQEEIEADVYPSVLVIGGGIAGMTAALSLANQNIAVHLVEQQNRLGGLMVNLNSFFPIDHDTHPIIEQVEKHPNITLHLGNEIQGISGFIGNFDIDLKAKSFKVGTIIVATGAKELKPFSHYRYGEMEGIMTQLELEGRLSVIGDRLSQTEHPTPNTVVMINCVGARVDERMYCSRFCCIWAMKNACLIKEHNPNANIYILHRDVMAYGTEFEKYYKQAREKGIRFIRYHPLKLPQVIGHQKVEAVKVYHELVGKEIELPANIVVLTTPLVPQDDAEQLSKLLKVPLGSEGFFLEAHLKLRPVEFSTDGIYLCGSCRYPADVPESITQAYAASAKASIPIINGKVKVEAITALANKSLCSGCGNCIKVCPFEVIEFKEKEVGQTFRFAKVNEIECKGCGLCVSVCPNGAMQQKGFTDTQLLAMIDALTEPNDINEPKILIFACNWCSYAGADLAGVSRIEMPTNCRIIRVMCSARVRAEFLLYALSKGIDGVMILGCHPGECHYSEGNYYTRRRGIMVKKILDFCGIEPERVQINWISASEGNKFAEIVKEMVEKIKPLTTTTEKPKIY
ncbi:MAG: hydrogenase iron-sulfur subunit [Candidatus Stahlbacteria bacterium]|nr:hydrogenase iron-sulfur subunit [Candidatus Stahlbacteria bacterium]